MRRPNTPSIGLWLLWGEPAVLSAASRAGFDWLAIDQQHGRFDDRAMREALSVPRDHRADVMVRVGANDPMLIGRALDSGADGVIVPMVRTVADAERAVAACRHPPAGIRSSGPPLVTVRDDAPDRGAPRCSIMIETAEALAAVRAIAAVDGVDELFVGPVDLSAALGRSLEELVSGGDELRAVVAAAHDAGIPASCFAGSARAASAFVALGFDAVAAATEDALVDAGAAAVRAAVLDPAPGRAAAAATTVSY